MAVDWRKLPNCGLFELLNPLWPLWPPLAMASWTRNSASGLAVLTLSWQLKKRTTSMTPKFLEWKPGYGLVVMATPVLVTHSANLTIMIMKILSLPP